MNAKLTKLYAKSDSLMARIEELQAKETLTEAEDLELTNAINDCTKVEDDISREVKADKLREVRNQPENSPWRPGNRQIASNGITKDFKDFGEQLTAVYKAAVPGGKVDDRLNIKAAASGANESVPSDGGFLVQQDFIQQLLEDTYTTGKLVNRTQKIPISPNSNGVKINGVDEKSRANGSRYGGIQVYTEAEADLHTGSKPKFRQIELNLHKVTGLFYATDELLQDASALSAWIMNLFPLEFGFKIDDLLIRGTGAGECQGILNSGALITIDAEKGQAAKTIVTDNILKMVARCNARNPVWYINRNTIPQLFQLGITKGATFIPIYIPAGGISGKPYATLWGFPVEEIEQCDTLGTKGDILLADFGEYDFIDKGGIDSAVSIHVRFLYDEQVFRFIYRCDGQTVRSTPLTPFKGEDTLSSFVALATRS
jgi:HK97 family phage major capsid protein